MPTDQPAAAAASELDELICFDLYAASRAITAAYRPVLAELGLTYPQYLVLVVLWEREQCPISHLAETLRLDHGTLTPLLKRMESAGLVERTRRVDDERSVMVRATPAGQALAAHREPITCRIEEALGLDAAQVGTLRDLLRVVQGRAGHH